MQIRADQAGKGPAGLVRWVGESEGGMGAGKGGGRPFEDVPSLLWTGEKEKARTKAGRIGTAGSEGPLYRGSINFWSPCGNRAPSPAGSNLLRKANSWTRS
jgi:hypothetical protein